VQGTSNRNDITNSKYFGKVNISYISVFFLKNISDARGLF